MRRFETPKSRWRIAALCFAIAAFSTFLFNLLFIIWAITRRGETIQNDVGVLLDQDCSTAKTVNTGIHIIINVFSIILLAGSNYCMQCLIAPTRSEIDDAHAKQNWLDVGVSTSIRNFWRMAWRKKIIWVLLCCSSLPLHLIYNSVIFRSTSVNNYNVLNTDARILRSSDQSTISGNQSTSMYNDFLDGEQVEQLGVADCIKAYAVALQSSRGNLLLISDDEGHENRTTATFDMPDDDESPRYSWMCDASNMKEHQLGNFTCNHFLEQVRINSLDWNPLGSVVKECYSQRTDEHCKVLFSRTLCWIVVVLNLFKGVLMLLVAFGGGDENPILTVGDAVASFLQTPDESTTDMCLKSKDHFVAQHWLKGPLPFDLRPQRKSAAVTPGHWFLCFSLYFGLIIACAFLLIQGLSKISGEGDIKKFGLGAIHTKTILSVGSLGRESLLPYILLVNTPQVIVSVIYFTYNAQCTSISLITEWDRFSNNEEPKGLRVSTAPRGLQRETYFLQLPYRYSIPLISFSGVLHWLISQSFFLVNLEVYAPSSNSGMSMAPLADEESISGLSSVTACGWSPLGVLCVLVVIILMMGFLIIAERRRLRFGTIPVAGSCSAAISAACHPDSDEGKMWEKALGWGVVDSSGIGHCSFSSEPVKAPVRGQMYT